MTTLLVFTKYNILWFKVLFTSGMAEYQVTSKPVSSTLGFSLVSFQRLPRPEKFPAVLTQVWDFGDNVVSLNVSHDAGGLALLATHLAKKIKNRKIKNKMMLVDGLACHIPCKPSLSRSPTPSATSPDRPFPQL